MPYLVRAAIRDRACTSDRSGTCSSFCSRVELAGNDARRRGLAAAIDRQLRARRRACAWYIGQTNRAADEDPRAAARDDADRLLAVDNGVTVACDRALALGELEAD